ncbi:MAG: hypothetical protein H8E31_00375 [Planctomycetes bacterium]|nr:hypothetical protein [Planctomycetota bacterium]
MAVPPLIPLALTFACLAGGLVGAGATGSFPHALWPVLAGAAVGAVCALAAARRRMLLALGGSAVAVGAAVATIVWIQLRRGHWPILDEFTREHYGGATQAALRAAVLLAVLIGLPSLLAAAAVSLAKGAPGRRRRLRHLGRSSLSGEG